jgi:acyl carrier protein
MGNNIEERIRNVMSAVFEISADQIQDNSSSDTIKSWDSLKHMNLVIALEEEFDCEFSDTEVTELLSFKLISTILKEYI